MVGGVESSAGSSAYLRGSQLGSGSSVSRNKPPVDTSDRDKDSAPVSITRERASNVEAAAASRTTEAKTFSTSRQAPSNDHKDTGDEDSAPQAQQSRGSLVDIAV